ncbi:ABC transporter permease [Paenibacillus wenxiniae]|uniref:Transport permease protein n=1 Tax=Paenibacillus wenxiniae TaxID=1636843 RepID=A0ABW4RJ08_9BACL
MKNPVIKRILLILIAFILTVCFFYIMKGYQQATVALKLTLQYKSNINAQVQLFYADQQDAPWSEEHSVSATYDKSGDWQQLQFAIPQSAVVLRLDTGNQPAQVNMKDITLKANQALRLDMANLQLKSQQIEISNRQTGVMDLRSSGNDPYFSFNIEAFKPLILKGSVMYDVLFLVCSLVVAFLCAWSLRNAKEAARYVKYGIQGRGLIFSLAKNDFKTKYAASYLGVVWGFIQPLITIVTYWFVFQIGLRSGDVSSVPFILWFIAGIIPWFFFSEALLGGTNVFVEYSYLVKKVVFKIELLPIVKIVSALFVHLFFVAFIFVVYAAYGHYPKLIDVQLLYYLICSLTLVFALATLTSAIILFFKDLNQIIGIILQVGFWFTPIGWTVTMLNSFWAFIFKLNPMFYIVQGYRDTFIDGTFFWQRPYQTLYFWIFCMIVLIVGIKIFKKLKPHFSDVL